MTTATLQSGYELILETPSIADYRRLRVASGLSPKSLEAATAGLPNTLFAVVIRKDGEAIGMGRIIGDSGLFFQIVDIAVDPAHQGHGLGKAIVATLVEHLHKIALPGAYISLIADGEAHRLYAQYGFQPTAPASIGMYLPTR
jgi:GNAT superfamily N-acetyltransferase